MNDNGYYQQYRDELQDPYFQHDIVNNWQAFSDLKSLAQYRAKEIPVNSKVRVKLDKGELFTSRNKLADRWKWEQSKVTRFLNQLENRGYIECTGDRTGTKIKILRLASDEQPSEQPIEQPPEQPNPSKIKGLQKPTEQMVNNQPNNQPHNQANNQNIAKSRGCEGSPNNQANNHPNNQPNNNTEEVKNNNSVCVENHPTPPIGKMIFSDEQYTQLVNQYGESKVKRVIAKAERYYSDTREVILEPLKVFKKFAASDKGEPKQENRTKTPSQRKPIQNSFNNFKQRNYDMDELERKLIGH